MLTRMLESQDTGKVYRVILDGRTKEPKAIEVIDNPQFRRLDENSKEYAKALGDVILSIIHEMAAQSGGNDAAA